LAVGCADVTPPEDGFSRGDVTVLKDWFTSALLLESGDAVVLFDAGYRDGKMTRLLDDRGHAPDDVTHVFLTHGHSDHLGLLPELSATVHALAEEASLVEEESEGEVTIDVFVEDGVSVDVGDTVVEVFAVPGHTAGSAVYLVNGVLVLGDSALVNRDGDLVPVAEKRSDDPQMLVESMRALADRLAPRADDVRWLAPSHSAWMEGFEGLREF
jgi:glyoxylase-like metal-dependent hydrolase (beta-lactamase superfamily II)